MWKEAEVHSSYYTEGASALQAELAGESMTEARDLSGRHGAPGGP
jgi:hypothetical protein